MNSPAQNHKALATLIVFVIIIGFLWWSFKNHPYITVGLIIFAGMVAGNWPQKCYVCQNPLSKHVYKWPLDGQNRRVCSHCNQSLQKQNSREAMKNRNPNL